MASAVTHHTCKISPENRRDILKKPKLEAHRAFCAEHGIARLTVEINDSVMKNGLPIFRFTANAPTEALTLRFDALVFDVQGRVRFYTSFSTLPKFCKNCKSGNPYLC